MAFGKVLKKHLNERGFRPIKKKKGKKTGKKIIVQMDKSTCQSYNRGLNEFGYFGVSTKKTKEILEKIGEQ